MGLSITGAVRITGRFTASSTTLPGPPASMTVGYGSTSGYVLLSWSAPSSPGTFPVTGYQINSVPETTNPATPITLGNVTSLHISGLSATTYYSFSVAAITPSGVGTALTSSTLYYSCQLSSSVASAAVYNTPGSYTWVVPAGVTSISAVSVGGGGGGGLAPTPFSPTANGGNSSIFGTRTSYVVHAGGGTGGQWACATTLGAPPGGSVLVGTGGAGGAAAGVPTATPTQRWETGGGGAGGYIGAGGASCGAGATGSPTVNTGVGGGGGLTVATAAPAPISTGAGAGGGVGICGASPIGTGANAGAAPAGGSGGSGGCAGGAGSICSSTGPGAGGTYGGGGAAGAGGPYVRATGGGGGALAYANDVAVIPTESYTVVVGAGGYTLAAPLCTRRKGGGGAVRIIWPGNERRFPLANASGTVGTGPYSRSSTNSSTYVLPTTPSITAAYSTGTDIVITINSATNTSPSLPTYAVAVTATPGNITQRLLNTYANFSGLTPWNSTGTLTFTGLTANTLYTFTAQAYNARGYSSATTTVSTTTLVASSSTIFTVPGTYSWIAPTAVTSVSVLAVGGGGGGGSASPLTGGAGGNSSFGSPSPAPVVVSAGGGSGASGAPVCGGSVIASNAGLSGIVADSAYNSQGWNTGGTDYTAGATGAWSFTGPAGQGGSGGARSVALSSGKYYFEVTVVSGGSGYWLIGMANSSSGGGYNNVPSIFAYDGGRYGGLTGGTAFGSFPNGTVIQFAYDTTVNQFWIGKNGTWYIDPSSAGTTLPGTGAPRLFVMDGSSNTSATGTFKQSSPTYTVPSGFAYLTYGGGASGGGGAGGVGGNGGGGGAGGYTGAGGIGGGSPTVTAGTGGAGGGGIYAGAPGPALGGSGGGVGLYGPGESGAAGAAPTYSGGGGSGGLSSTFVTCRVTDPGGNMFGGGGGGVNAPLGGGGGGGGALAYGNNIAVTATNSYTVIVGSGGTSGNTPGAKAGASGAVRIVWPGLWRQFPNCYVSSGWDASTTSTQFPPTAPVTTSTTSSFFAISVGYSVTSLYAPVYTLSGYLTSASGATIGSQSVSVNLLTGSTATGVLVFGNLDQLTTYTATVYTYDVYGNGIASTVTTTSTMAYGSISYTTSGSYTFVAPTGITSVSVLAVGAGGSGAGNGTSGQQGGSSVFSIACVAQVTAGGGGGATHTPALIGPGGTGSFGPGIAPVCRATFAGGNGGLGFNGCGAGSGGGAGGYSGNGGSGATYTVPQSGASSPGGGGGGGGYNGSGSGGGGVGLFGAGSNGAGSGPGIGGGGGSGGSSGGNAFTSPGPVIGAIGGSGGNYGGGSGGNFANAPSSPSGRSGGGGGALAYANNITVSPGASYSVTVGAGGSSSNSPASWSTATTGGSGALRIVWPGDLRKFPSTSVSTT